MIAVGNQRCIGHIRTKVKNDFLSKDKSRKWFLRTSSARLAQLNFKILNNVMTQKLFQWSINPDLYKIDSIACCRFFPGGS